MSKRLKGINKIFLITAILFIGIFSGCNNKSIETNKEVSTAAEKASVSNITPEEAKKRLDNEKGIILLDVRTKEEYNAGHIKGSILIPVDNLLGESVKTLKDKEAPIFVYCRSGNRSLSAVNILIKQGYTNVFNLGGINKWPFEVIK